MSKPWPDEVRAMVAALTRDDVLSQVTPLSPTTWRVSVPYADADYGPGSMPWTCNGVRYRSWRVMRAELTRVAVLAPRIHDAVPDARVTTTTDGIEVSVGSKSVRWKRERNGWSLGDDLFTSDDRVIEHARAMAADAAAEAQWKLASDLATGLKAKGVETCTVRNLDTGVVTVSAKDTLGCWHSAELRDGRWHYSGVEIATTAEAYRVLLEAAAPPKPAAPQPSPRAQALLDALRAQGYEPEYEQTASAEHVLCASEQAAMHSGEALWWYLGAQAGTEYVAEQMHLRITRSRLRAIDEQSRREKAHAAKGTTTMTTQDPEQRRRDEGVVMAELCRDVLRKHPNAVASARVVESERDWYYTLVLSEHFDDVEVQYENGRFYLYQRNATTAPSLTLEQARAVLLTSSTALIPMDDENTRTRARRIPSKRAVIHDIERIAPYSQWIAERTKRNEGATTMTTQTKTEALAQTIKLDASEAAWRTAGSQFVKLAREPLVGLLTRHLAPNDDAFRARLAAFLETELGTALLASMLSATLSAMPQTTGEVPQKLARELRVKAMATAGDEIASVLSGPLLQVMRLYLQDPAGAPAAAPALDAPQAKSVEWATAEQKEGAR